MAAKWLQLANSDKAKCIVKGHDRNVGDFTSIAVTRRCMREQPAERGGNPRAADVRFLKPPGGVCVDGLVTEDALGARAVAVVDAGRKIAPPPSCHPDARPRSCAILVTLPTWGSSSGAEIRVPGEIHRTRRTSGGSGFVDGVVAAVASHIERNSRGCPVVVRLGAASATRNQSSWRVPRGARDTNGSRGIPGKRSASQIAGIHDLGSFHGSTQTMESQICMHFSRN